MRQAENRVLVVHETWTVTMITAKKPGVLEIWLLGPKKHERSNNHNPTIIILAFYLVILFHGKGSLQL